MISNLIGSQLILINTLRINKGVRLIALFIPLQDSTKPQVKLVLILLHDPFLSTFPQKNYLQAVTTHKRKEECLY